MTKILELAKHKFPMVPVLARAFDREHALELVKAGADFQMNETLESAFAVGRQALLTLSGDPDVVAEVMEGFRNRDLERFEMECVGGLFARRDLLLCNRNPTTDGTGAPVTRAFGRRAQMEARLAMPASRKAPQGTGAACIG